MCFFLPEAGKEWRLAKGQTVRVKINKRKLNNWTITANTQKVIYRNYSNSAPLNGRVSLYGTCLSCDNSLMLLNQSEKKFTSFKFIVRDARVFRTISSILYSPGILSPKVGQPATNCKRRFFNGFWFRNMSSITYKKSSKIRVGEVDEKRVFERPILRSMETRLYVLPVVLLEFEATCNMGQ